MSWWWDNYIDPLNLWSEFAGLSRFAAGMTFRGAHLAFASLPPAIAATGPHREVMSFGRLLKNGNTWAAWWKNDAYQWAIMGEGTMPSALPPSVQKISGLARAVMRSNGTTRKPVPTSGSPSKSARMPVAHSPWMYHPISGIWPARASGSASHVPVPFQRRTTSLIEECVSRKDARHCDVEGLTGYERFGLHG